MYESWIVDECGYEVCRVRDIERDGLSLEEVLENHPEWSVRCICTDSVF